RGIPFREAYQVVGTLVRRLQEMKLPLAQTPLELAREINPLLDAELLSVAQPQSAVRRKEVPGGTGPQSVRSQLTGLRSTAASLTQIAAAVPSLDTVLRSLKEAAL